MKPLNLIAILVLINGSCCTAQKTCQESYDDFVTDIVHFYNREKRSASVKNPLNAGIHWMHRSRADLQDIFKGTKIKSLCLSLE